MKAADRIREALEEAIVEGEFAEGERLDEVRLSERFGASRTPVREALLALAASGLVEQVPRRGVFVRQLGPTRVIEMFEVMAHLEALCGRLAAERIDADALRTLRAALDDCERASAGGDTDRYYHANERFHRVIYAVAGNAFLAAEAERLQRQLAPFRRLQLRAFARMRQSLQEHRAIVEAVAAGDAEEADRSLRDHVAIQSEKFTSLMALWREGRAA